MLDLDGSLTGGANNVVVYSSNITGNDNRCKPNPSKYINAVVCSNTKDWIRFSFNNLNQDTVIWLDTTNYKNDTDSSPKLKKRITHPLGFMVDLEVNQTYLLQFEQALYPTNLTYSGVYYSIKPYQYLIIQHQLNKKPDQVTVFYQLSTESLAPLSIQNNNGDWYWDNATRTLSYIIHNREAIQPIFDAQVNFKAIKCRWVNCKEPTQPALATPPSQRPDSALLSSESDSWLRVQIIRANNGRKRRSISENYPQEGDSIRIPSGVWLVLNTPLPRLQRIQIDGTLEFDDSLDHTLVAENILINGGTLVGGWENAPFNHKINIVLAGEKKTVLQGVELPDGFDQIGLKGIGVYGTLDLHGIPRKPSWTKLSKTASSGTNVLNLIEPVDWVKGEEIVVSTTSFAPEQTETFRIVSVSADNKSITLNETLKYDHLVFKEILPNGQRYQMAAGVGLLSRNIRIIGEEYPQQFSDLFGFRIIVSDYSTFAYAEGSTTPIAVYYKGHARISDVEFVHGGQYTRESEDDYKYGILFSNLGQYNPTRPTYVRNSAFHDGFAAAIGILISASIPIESNVIHRALSYGLKIEGHSNIIRNNFVVYTLWAPTFAIIDAPFDRYFRGAIDISNAQSAIVENNLIAGAERIGFNYRGSPCSGYSFTAGLNHSINGNVIYGALAGVTVLPDTSFSFGCLLIANHTVSKSTYWGLYYQAGANVIMENNTLFDNQVNVFSQVFRPNIVEHAFMERYFILRNSLIVGSTSYFDCEKDVIPNNTNIEYASVAKSFNANGGKVGVVWGNFISGPNGAPRKPWSGIKSYNGLGGLTTIDNVTFANFSQVCGSNYDTIIISSLNNDDGQHPVNVQNIKLFNVLESSKVYLFRPDIGKVNPSDCLDMDCDGKKKNLLSDKDGSFLGKPGAVISQSEFEWGSQQRGLGDFRIPKEMLSDANGHMITPSNVYTYPGIVRDAKNCTFIDEWQAYKCYGLDYRMLLIESLDNDTESRRLSPVAILSDNKYLDFINGPQGLNIF